MAVMDEFKTERESVKNGGFKAKFRYFWEYYKWYAIIPLVVIIVLVNFIYHRNTDPETILEGIFLNVYNDDGEYTMSDLATDFIKEQNIDSSESNASFNTSLSYVSEVKLQERLEAEEDDAMNEMSASQINDSTRQVLMTQDSAGILDFIAGPQDCMHELLYSENFADLSEVLTEEQYARYEPYFLYIDIAVLEKRQEAYDNMEDTSSIPLPDMTTPENMSQPVPVLIDISHCKDIVNAYGYDAGPLAFGIMSNSKNKDTTLEFIDYIMN